MNAGNGSLAGLSTDELRAAVRAVLRDVLPAAVTQNGAGHAHVAGSPNGAGHSHANHSNGAANRNGSPVADLGEVTLRSDADLDAFVRRVAALCDDPAQRAALREGRRRFRLSATPSPGPAAAPGGASVRRVEQGAVTERTVKQAAADGARLVLGRRAVLTPLARDKARILGVVIEKER